MKKIILTLCIVLFSVCFTAAHAQREIEAPKDDEYIDEGYPGDDFDGDPKAGDENPCDACGNIPNIRFQFNSNSLFTSALQNEANIRRAAKEGARSWYSEQTGIIERVLESKYNKSFSSFNTAKDHAFLEYERAGIRLHSLPIYNSNLRLRDQRSSKRRVYLKAFKALRVRETEIAQNIHNTYYPYLEVNGVSINTLKNITDIRREYNKLLPVFKENKWKEFENNHIAKILGTPFNNEVIKIRNDRYNSLDYWDRLDFMQFLIHFEEFKRLSRPPYLLAGDAARIFNKYTSRAEDIVTDKLVTDYINRNKNNELSLFHPDYWKVILKRDFGNLGFKSHDARLRHQNLMNAEIERLSNSPINANRSIDNLIKELSIRDKYKVQWLNDHPTKATTFINKINEAIKKDNQGEFGNTVGGDLNLVGSRWHYGLAQLAIDSEIEKGLAAASLIYDVGITDINQKKWLYENEDQADDLKLFGDENKVQNTISTLAQNYIKGQIELETLAKDIPWETGTGVIANRANLRYTHFYHAAKISFFKLEDGSIVGISSYEKALTKSGELRDRYYEPTGASNNERYYYIKVEGSQWADLLIPQSNTVDELQHLFLLAGKEIGKSVGRYALPIEDLKIMIEGKDFDGQKASRWKAAGFLLLTVVPGSKGFKVVTRVASNAGKWAKIVTSVTGKSVRLKARLVNGLVHFGTDSNSRRVLRKVLGLVSGAAQQAHHIIPLAMKELPIIQKAARAAKRFHINELLNGIPLNSTNHLRGHGLYNDAVEAVLIRLNGRVGNNLDEAYQETTKFISYLDNLIRSNPNSTLGEIAALINYR